MTQRPVFLPVSHSRQLVEQVSVKFHWHPGFSASQKRKNVLALHSAAASLGLSPLLEVSTKSEEALGRALSAFNFEVGIAPARKAPIEIAYQASKVFEGGGPYTDLFDGEPREAKRDPRLRESGPLVAFHFGGLEFPLEPVTAFYDWLFLRAFARNQDIVEQLSSYAGFTDIEFNPEKSINCQARSCATAVTLARRDELGLCAKSFARFVWMIDRTRICVHHPKQPQQELSLEGC